MWTLTKFAGEGAGHRSTQEGDWTTPSLCNLSVGNRPKILPINTCQPYSPLPHTMPQPWFSYGQQPPPPVSYSLPPPQSQYKELGQRAINNNTKAIAIVETQHLEWKIWRQRMDLRQEDTCHLTDATIKPSVGNAKEVRKRVTRPNGVMARPLVNIWQVGAVNRQIMIIQTISTYSTTNNKSVGGILQANSLRLDSH